MEKKESNVESYTNNAPIYNINVSANKERTALSVCLYINPKKTPGPYDLVKGFYKLDDVDRMSLLIFFLRDAIMLSFAPDYVNAPRDLEWKHDISDAAKGKHFVSVENKKKEPLRMRKEHTNTDKRE